MLVNCLIFIIGIVYDAHEELCISAELEANAFIPQFTAEHGKGHSGKASRNNT